MNTQSIEQFIAGADEINRQRKVITRIINSLISSINTMEGLKKRWGWCERIFDVEVPEFGEIDLTHYKGNVNFNFNKKCWTTNGADDFILREVPLIYAILPKLVETTDAFIPEANIDALFKFLINYTPK